MSLTKILCATDFSECAGEAVRVAARIARERGAELVLAHAWYMPVIGIPEMPFPGVSAQELAVDSRRMLETAVGVATAAGARHVSGQLLSGPAWTAIVEHLEGHAYDLCVVGTRGRTGLTRVLLGSVAERVVRHAPCPVLVVRASPEARPFRHVLVPVDFSTSSEEALGLAARMIEPDGRITLLHVLELPIVYGGPITSADFAQALDASAAEALELDAKLLATLSTAAVTTVTRIGTPGAQTLAALDHDATIDLVVMGSHGRTGVKRALIGSVAEKVVRHARCPVLVARKRD